MMIELCQCLFMCQFVFVRGVGALLLGAKLILILLRGGKLDFDSHFSPQARLFLFGHKWPAEAGACEKAPLAALSMAKTTH